VFRPLFGRSNPAAMPLAAERARKLALASGALLVVGTVFGAVAQASDAANVPVWGVFGQPLFDLLSRGRFATLFFNGGPDGGTGNPAVTVTWSGSDKATGDFEVVTGLSKTGCTVTIKDATGTSRARSNVSIYVEGW